MRFFILYSIFYFLLVSDSVAQQPLTRIINTQELSHNNQIQVMMQCSRQFMWLGTRKGLYMYDSYRMETIVFPGDSMYYISALYEAEDKTIWIGTASGRIYFLHPYLQRPQLWMPPEGLPKAPITAFATTKNNTFWISTYGEGLYYVQGSHMYNLGTDDGLVFPEIYDLSPASDSSVWFIADDALYQFHARYEDKNLIKTSINTTNKTPIFRSFSNNSNLWAGAYEEGLFSLNVGTGTLTQVYYSSTLHRLKQIEEGSNGLLYLLTEQGIVKEYNPYTQSISTIEIASPYSHAGVQSIYAGKNNMLWIATKSGHLIAMHLDYRFFETNEGEINTILHLNDRSVLAGTASGIFKADFLPDGSFVTQRVLPELKVHTLSMLKNEQGYVFISTFDEGLFIINPELNAYRQLTVADGLINNSILSIALHGEKIWCATLGGAMAISFSGKPLSDAVMVFDYSSDQQAGSRFIYQLFSDSKGNLWFATDGMGLLKMDEKGQFSNYQKACGHAFKTVYSVTEDFEGNIWFSTPTDGILNLYAGKNCHYNIQNGLQHQEVVALFASPDGYLHVVYPDGIHALNISRRHLHYFDFGASGIRLDPNLNALSSAMNREIWLGTSRGIIRWLHLQTDSSFKPAGVSWKSITGNQKLQPWDGSKVKLDYNNHIISFYFAGVNYHSNLAQSYRYKLKGHDQHWKTTKDDHLTFVGLQPGDYRLLLSAETGPPFSGEGLLQFDFTIHPPWWRTWWFILISVLVLVYLIYAVINFRDQNVKQEAERKKFQVETQYELLKNQVRPHFLFNSFNTLAGLIEENPKNAVNYVEKMSDLYRNILQYRETDVIPLEKELQILNDYFFLLRQRYGNRLEIINHLTGDEGYIAPLTLQMMLENAVKHNTISATKQLTIELSCLDGHFITITNNINPKRKKEPSTGFGLKGIKDRYEILSGEKVTYQMTEKHFTVNIPLIRKTGL